MQPLRSAPAGRRGLGHRRLRAVSRLVAAEQIPPTEIAPLTGLSWVTPRTLTSPLLGRDLPGRGFLASSTGGDVPPPDFQAAFANNRHGKGQVWPRSRRVLSVRPVAPMGSLGPWDSQGWEFCKNPGKTKGAFGQ